jgi:hypothetical protein
LAPDPDPPSPTGPSAGPNAITGRVIRLSSVTSGGNFQPLKVNVFKISWSVLSNPSKWSSSSSNDKSVNKPVVFNGVSPAWATPGKNRMSPARSDSVDRADADVALLAAVDVSPCSAVEIV